MFALCRFGVSMELRCGGDVQRYIAIHSTIAECAGIGCHQSTHGALHAHAMWAITCGDRSQTFARLHTVVARAGCVCFFCARGFFTRFLLDFNIIVCNGMMLLLRFQLNRFTRVAIRTRLRRIRAIVRRIYHGGILASLIARADSESQNGVVYNGIGAKTNNSIAIAMRGNGAADAVARYACAVLQYRLGFLPCYHDAA